MDIDSDFVSRFRYSCKAYMESKSSNAKIGFVGLVKQEKGSCNIYSCLCVAASYVLESVHERKGN